MVARKTESKKRKETKPAHLRAEARRNGSSSPAALAPLPPKETLSLHVLYSHQNTSTGVENESDEPYSRRPDKHYTTTYKGVVVGKESDDYEYWSSVTWSHETFEVPKGTFDTPRAHVYLVAGYYSDGDSFSSSYGNVHFVDVYGNPEKAFAVARALQDEDREKNQSIFGPNRVVPWGGYFARLERVEVEVLPVIGVFTSVEDTGQGKRDFKDIPSW